MEYTKSNTSNDSLGLNYKGLTSFLSTNNTETIKFLGSMGYTNKSNSISNNNNDTIIMDSLLGIKRIYTSIDYSPIYKKVGKYNCSTIDGMFYDLGKTKCSIYNNKNALNLGYMINYDEKKYLKKINSKKRKQKNIINNKYTPCVALTPAAAPKSIQPLKFKSLLNNILSQKYLYLLISSLVLQ